jgi:hypothetical protein
MDRPKFLYLDLRGFIGSYRGKLYCQFARCERMQSHPYRNSEPTDCAYGHNNFNQHDLRGFYGNGVGNAQRWHSALQLQLVTIGRLLCNGH